MRSTVFLRTNFTGIAGEELGACASVLVNIKRGAVPAVLTRAAVTRVCEHTENIQQL